MSEEMELVKITGDLAVQGIQLSGQFIKCSTEFLHYLLSVYLSSNRNTPGKWQLEDLINASGKEGFGLTPMTILTEDPDEIAKFEKMLEDSGIQYAKLPDDFPGDGKTPIIVRDEHSPIVQTLHKKMFNNQLAETFTEREHMEKNVDKNAQEERTKKAQKTLTEEGKEIPFTQNDRSIADDVRFDMVVDRPDVSIVAVKKDALEFNEEIDLSIGQGTASFRLPTSRAGKDEGVIHASVPSSMIKHSDKNPNLCYIAVSPETRIRCIDQNGGSFLMGYKRFMSRFDELDKKTMKPKRNLQLSQDAPGASNVIDLNRARNSRPTTKKR